MGEKKKSTGADVGHPVSAVSDAGRSQCCVGHAVDFVGAETLSRWPFCDFISFVWRGEGKRGGGSGGHIHRRLFHSEIDAST